MEVTKAVAEELHEFRVSVKHGTLGAETSGRGDGMFGVKLLPKLASMVPNSFLLLVVRPGAPSSVLAPSSDALCS